ncbi:MAG: YebC/PmpR family DNA-binding transcriptional regulator [Bacteroidales bacterium]|jgi:YebC/PmpR family DNA-binding regulatory protein|nr:YebC/PmpR family DNA-binding transcriptional regulator [Bacteroidales bacterium]
MSGHNKWSTIKRKKGAIDAKRSKIFSKLAKEISIAVKEGGGIDSDYNSKLRIAIQNAKGVNMPKDNIERAIKKGDTDGANFSEITFEGYAPHGIAVFVECLSDNNNRTVSSVRSAFNRFSGSLGTNGSLSFLFTRKGVFEIPITEIKNFDDFELEIIDAGAEDIETEDENVTVTCALEDFGNLNKKLEELKINSSNAELRRIPTDTKSIPTSEAKTVLKLIDFLEDDDDVQNVFHNMELTEEMFEE